MKNKIITSEGNIQFIDSEGKVINISPSQVYSMINEDTVSFLLVHLPKSSGLSLFTTKVEDLELNGATYSQSTIADALAEAFSEAGAVGRIEVVDELPSEGKTNTIYLLPKDEGEGYDEYIYIKDESKWELIGDTSIEIKNFLKKSDFNEYSAATKTAIENEIDARESSDSVISGAVDSLSTDLLNESQRAQNAESAIDAKVSALSANTYTKAEVDAAVSGKVDASTFETYSGSVETALSAKVDTSAITTSITSGSTDSQVPSAKAVYDALQEGGGGKAIEAGRGISITTGETADTVSFNLPISAGTGQNSVVFGKDYGSDMFLSAYTPYVSSENSFAFGSASVIAAQNSFATGYLVKVKGSGGTNGNFAQGYMTTASGNRCHSEGLGTSSTADASHSEGHNTTASGNYSHSEGEEVKATNVAEHSQGRYNVSNKANTTWGDSGNTLFSVGNGTADNARHNAFEIRQNGDIYITKDGQDVKLQDQLGGGGGMTEDDELLLSTALVDLNDRKADKSLLGNYQRKGDYVTTSTLNTRLAEYETTLDEQNVEEVTAYALNDLNNRVTDNTTALGGMKLVKITESEYAALTTKDENTLYIVVADPQTR